MSGLDPTFDKHKYTTPSAAEGLSAGYTELGSAHSSCQGREVPDEPSVIPARWMTHNVGNEGYAVW